MADYPTYPNREVGVPSQTQSLSYLAQGNAEDLSSIITNIDPKKTPFLSSLPQGEDLKGTRFGWYTETLRPPKVNAVKEKYDFTSKEVDSLEQAENYMQTIINEGYMTDIQRKVGKVVSGDAWARAVRNALTATSKDMELAIMGNTVARAETKTEAAMTGGIPYFMKEKTKAVTINATTGKITTSDSSKHYLKTGDFVYFKGEELPEELQAGLIYYVCLDETDPDTTFTVYNTMEGAIKGDSDELISPSTAGTGVELVLNNVISMDGTTDFTIDDINDCMELANKRGGNPTDAYMSSRKKRRFSEILIGEATTFRNSGDHKLDGSANVFESDFGTITAKSHPYYSDKRIDLLDMSMWELRFLERPHQVKGLAVKGTYKEFVLKTSFGLKGTQPLASASLTNIKR